MNLLETFQRELNPKDSLMTSVGNDGDEESELEICLYFWGDKQLLFKRRGP